MGCKMRRVAPKERPDRLGKQRQPRQVLGSPHGNAAFDAVSHLVRSNVLTLSHRRHQHKNTIQALAWSPNGNLVASASRDQTVRVFDIRAMKELHVLKGHKKEVCCTSAVFSRLGRLGSRTFLCTQPSPGTPSTRSSSQAGPRAPFSTGTCPGPSRPRPRPRTHSRHTDRVRRSRRRTTRTSGA